MELISNYKTKLLSGDDKESDNDYKSETSLATSLGQDVNYNDLFGNADVATKSGAPVKGRKYLLFTLVMCIVLSVMVVMNSSTEDLKKAADAQVAADQQAPEGINIDGITGDSQEQTDQTSTEEPAAEDSQETDETQES